MAEPGDAHIVIVHFQRGKFNCRQDAARCPAAIIDHVPGHCSKKGTARIIGLLEVVKGAFIEVFRIIRTWIAAHLLGKEHIASCRKQ